MKKLLLGFIDNRAKIWIHYVTLGASIVLSSYLSNLLLLPQLYDFSKILDWFYSFLLMFALVSLEDDAFHFLFGD